MSPPARAMIAEIRVIPMAAAEPKTRVRTMIATAMPISSPTGAVCCWAMSMTWPRSETSSPDDSAASPTSKSRSPASLPSSLAGLSYWTVTNAIRPSLETWPLPSAESGSMAEVTFG